MYGTVHRRLKFNGFFNFLPYYLCLCSSLCTFLVHLVGAMRYLRRPVVYFRPAVEAKMAGKKNEILMIYTLERAIRLMPRGSWQYTVVIDCEGEWYSRNTYTYIYTARRERVGGVHRARHSPLRFLFCLPFVVKTTVDKIPYGNCY